MHEIKPKLSVDDIRLGCDIQTLIANGYIEKVDAYDEITGWQTFTRDDAVEFYVKNNSVVCIACFGDCVIEGVYIIGQTPSELIKGLGAPNEIGEAIWVSDDRQQVPYEYFSLGLQIWFESGKAVSVYCNEVY